MHIHVKHKYAQELLPPAAFSLRIADMSKNQRRKTYLREWRRLKHGRTLEQVAEQLHISQPQLGRIERGDKPYNQDLLEALADLYGCDVPDLLWRDPSDPAAIWSLWEKAKPGERKMIIATVDAIMRTGTSGSPRNKIIMRVMHFIA